MEKEKTQTNMNIDRNMYKKRLANRIQQYMKKLMYQDQVGFIQGKQDCLNTQKINVIHQISKGRKP